jgi:chromosome segregation protein
LYLKRLEIVGFKSFADAFELEFQKGISCIVGPNGCGKSNIADAIRWALGSQSPSELRADRMEDVIFSGTVDRKPQGMAEVILTFDNSQRSFNLDFDEITVTRRLFRSGESEYLLNGNRCRLMDVTDLIVDKGLGSNGYWILEKNMTEIIIESGPSDRRFLFDEAAGIVKYKMQRHRAELKLNAVASDLERLDDIISEVQRNMKQLKNQVSAYRRWERAERRISEIRGVLENRQLRKSEELLKELEKRIEKCRASEQKASAAAKAASGRQSNARLALERAQSQLDGEHARVSELDSEMSDVNQELAVARERHRNLSSRIETAVEEAEKERQRAERLLKDACQLSEKSDYLSGRLKEAREELERASEDSEKAEKDYAASAGKLEKARVENSALSDRQQSLQKEYTDNLRSRERAERELQLATERRDEIRSQLDSLKSSLQEAGNSLKEASGRRTEIADRIAVADEELKVLDNSLAGVRAETGEILTRREVLRSRISSLREVPEDSPAAGERLSARLEVVEGMGIAVGAWLDAFQDAAVLNAPDELPNDSRGHRYFLKVREENRPGIPEGGTWLPDCLRENSRADYAGLMSRAVLAPDAGTALSWFLRGYDLDFVTPDGDLFRRDGLVRLGVPESGGGAIEREALARDAEKTLETLTADIEKLRETEEDLAARVSETREDRELLRGRLSEAGRDEASMEATVRAREERLETLTDELDSVEKRIPELIETSSDQDSSDISGEMRRIREELDKLSIRLKSLEEERDENGARLNSLLRTENNARVEVTSLEASLNQARDEHQRLLKASGEASEHSSSVEGEIESLKAEKKGLEVHIEELRSRLDQLSVKREAAEKDRTEASQERASWLEKTREADEELIRSREELSSAREERAEVSGELQVVTERCHELRSRDTYLPPEESRYWEYSDEKLRSELEKQTGYRENLGPVNMLAVTEYEEGKKRIDFLTEQRADLDEARTSLLEAISEINRTAARKFDETFVEVRTHFKKMFTSLFGGGEADIMALDSEDPLEGGVQIVARPPGKKLENITALSSGERAMTAAALLFALYLVKPSPFCVLDELDAPLDDTNVDNYVNLLKGFVHRTQFIVITHNKRTMEAADRLFGITMVEQGVSTMTTVSLEKARRLIEGEV